MAFPAANLVSKLSFCLQSHVLSFPRTKRNAAILYLKKRDCSGSSSSFPIRYIPKKLSSEVDEHQNTSSTESFGDRVSGKNSDGVRRKFVFNEEAKMQKKMYGLSVSFDGQQGCEVKVNHDAKWIKCEPALEEPNMVAEDAGIQHERHILNKNVQEDKTMLDAQRMAVQLLAKRAFTAVELAKKLSAKRVPPNIVGALITDFQNRGMINDSLYAETFSESRWSSSSWGPKRIKQALFKKGVSNVDTEKALKSVFEDVQCGGEGEGSKHGMSKVSMDRLLVQTTKQWVRSENVPIEKRKSRIIRWLQYRGFNWGVISFILRKLESKNSSS